MKKRIHSVRRLGALCLTLSLLLCTAVGAAEPAANRAQARQADLNALYEGLQAGHPDLFANTPESEFLSYKAEIERRLADENDVTFILDLQSMAALVKDSHTNVNINAIAQSLHFYPLVLDWFDGQWVVSLTEQEHSGLLGAQVTALNGLDMEEVLARFGTLLSADNPVKLRRQFKQVCNVEELYTYLGLAESGESLELTLLDGSGQTRTLHVSAVENSELAGLSLTSLNSQRTSLPETSAKNVYYYSQELDEDTYYIQYNTCAEDPELPMETFAGQVRTVLEAGSYSRVIVDLRNNGGGSDGVIWPLLEVLRQAMDQHGVELVGLIGVTTFSSAIINAVELQEMGGILVGEAASGSVDHFGAVNGFTLPNSNLQVWHSTKYIDLGTLLDADAGRGVQALTPDVSVPQTVSDYLAGRDSCVDYLLSHKEALAQAAYPDAPLTRGRLAGLFYGAAGKPEVAVTEMPFRDLLGIEWYLPAINWAAGVGIAKGTGSGFFSSARAVTWQEAAVFLTRFADSQGIAPAVSVSSPVPAALLDGAWDVQAVERAWSWGAFPTDADFSATLTRSQGEAMFKVLV